MQPRRLDFFLACAAAAVWSLTGPGIGYLLDAYAVPRLTLAFWRDVFVTLVVLPFALLRFGLPARRDLARFALAGALFIGLYHALWVLSVDLNGPAVAVVLIYTFPSFATLGAWLLWQERPTTSAIGGLALAFLGCLLVVRAYDPELLVLNWLGVVCGITTGVAQAGFSLFGQRALRAHNAWTTLAWTMLFGSLTLLLMQRPATILAIDGVWPWLILALLAIGPTLGGYVLYTTSLRSLPAGVAGTVVTLEAPIAALLAAVWLGQWLEWPQLLGMTLIVIGAGLPQLVGWHHTRQLRLRGGHV